MNNEIRLGLEMDIYRAADGLSKHQLDNFAVSPSYYQWKLTKEWNPSRTMELGTLAHSQILEGHVDYVLGPSVDRRTKAGKDEWQEFCEDNLGKTIVTMDEYSQLTGAAAAVRPLMERIRPVDIGANPDIYIETSMFWERSGLQCKGRPDLIGEVNGRLAIVDLKTTSDIQRWDSKFFSLRYDVQAAWYAYGLQKVLEIKETPEFWFLVVDFESPHLCQFVLAGHEIMEQANAKIEHELDYFSACQESNDWPGLPQFRVMLPRGW